MEMALRTGMRKGELLGLNWEQIREGLIYLRETKSKKPRQIPIDERLGQLFRELKAKNKWKSPYVFLGPDGKPWPMLKKPFWGLVGGQELKILNSMILRAYLCLPPGHERGQH